jgi:molybdopterin-guanine dinucleotide biosynthesis protein A
MKDASSPADKDLFIAAVLAGGRGRRLGMDKSRLEVDGKTVLERALDCLVEIFKKVLLVVQDPDFIAPAGYHVPLEVVVDILPGKGPLGGIYTALQHSPAPYVFVMACDMPYPSRALIRCLLAEAPGREAVVPRRNEYIEPLFAVYSREIRDGIRTRLEENRLKIHELIDELDVRYLTEDEIAACDPDSRSFFNINTPEDLDRARRI